MKKLITVLCLISALAFGGNYVWTGAGEIATVITNALVVPVSTNSAKYSYYVSVKNDGPETIYFVKNSNTNDFDITIAIPILAGDSYSSFPKYNDKMCITNIVIGTTNGTSSVIVAFE